MVQLLPFSFEEQKDTKVMPHYYFVPSGPMAVNSSLKTVVDFDVSLPFLLDVLLSFRFYSSELPDSVYSSLFFTPHFSSTVTSLLLSICRKRSHILLVDVLYPPVGLLPFYFCLIWGPLPTVLCAVVVCVPLSSVTAVTSKDLASLVHPCIPVSQRHAIPHMWQGLGRHLVELLAMLVSNVLGS